MGLFAYMKETRYFYVPRATEQQELPPDEATHATRVLRMTEGDEIYLMDGCGTFHRALITMATPKHCCYHIEESMPQQQTWSGHIHLAIAPTKMMERMEWMVEKAVEIGVDEISFLSCHNSERTVIKLPRIEKIAIAAMKQSRKPFMTKLNEMQSVADFIAHRPNGHLFVAHCWDEISRQYLPDLLAPLPHDAPLTVMIGPEGDFTQQEVDQALAAGATSISLGESRLRTETAGLAAVMMMNLKQRKAGQR